MKVLPFLFVALLLLSSVVIISDGASAATNNGFVSVNGTYLRVGGVNQFSTFEGVVDTTVLQFAIKSFIDGDTEFTGWNQNFPFECSKLNVSTVAELWHAYFYLCDHYDIRLVRIGAGDAWGSEIQYEAWLNHNAAYFSILDQMCLKADRFNVYVELVLAGAAGSIYDYGEADSVFDTGSVAYSNYIDYAADTLNHFNSTTYTNSIFSFDVFNEPDSDDANTLVWSDNKGLFSAWASNTATLLTPQSSHIVEMGVAGQGTLFGFSQADFNLCTGNTGFDVCDRHYYASANDAYLFSNPISWAAAVNKPLIWSELAYNAVYPLVRWDYAEEQISLTHKGAFMAMVMTGTPGYPFVGSYQVTDTESTSASASIYSFFMPWMMDLAPVMQWLTSTADTPQEFYNNLVEQGASPEAGVAFIMVRGYSDWNQTSYYSLEYMWPYIDAAYPLAGLDSWVQTAAWLYTFSPPITELNFYEEMLQSPAGYAFAAGVIDQVQLDAINEGLGNLDDCIAAIIAATPLTPGILGDFSWVTPGMTMLGVMLAGTVCFAFFYTSMRRR